MLAICCCYSCECRPGLQSADQSYYGGFEMSFIGRDILEFEKLQLFPLVKLSNYKCFFGI
jgi:hypothetical protein